MLLLDIWLAYFRTSSDCPAYNDSGLSLVMGVIQRAILIYAEVPTAELQLQGKMMNCGSSVKKIWWRLAQDSAWTALIQLGSINRDLRQIVYRRIYQAGAGLVALMPDCWTHNAVTLQQLGYKWARHAWPPRNIMVSSVLFTSANYCLTLTEELSSQKWQPYNYCLIALYVDYSLEIY